MSRGVVVLGLAGLVGVTGLAAATASPSEIRHNRSGLTRAEVAEGVSASPGVPLVLPRHLLPDLIWLGQEGADQGDDDAVIARSSTFAHQAMDSGPTVSVCAERPTGGSTCSQGDRTIRRHLGSGERVVIAFYGAAVPPDELEWWTHVPLEQVELPDWVR